MFGFGAGCGWGVCSRGVGVSMSSGVAVGGVLEREAELARVDRLFERAGSGVGAVVVVEGAAGIGKSELLAAVRAGAQARGFGVLSARGSEFESEIGFGVARQLFEPMVRAASAGERRGLLGGVARVGARAIGVAAGEPPSDRFAAIHGLFWLCANRAERGPLVVAVDDVQWVDNPSQAWLGYVARRAGDLALVLVLALRSGDPGAVRGELARLVDDRGVQRLVLGPLSAAAVEVIVREQLDEDADEPFCVAVSELSGGNPLLVRELLMAALAEGLSARGDSVRALELIAPAAVGTSVLARLGRLGAEAVALARAVAVLGDGAEVGPAAELAGLDPSASELIADRLAAAQILAAVRPLEFFHPLIGAAVLEDIAPGARRVAHRRAAALVDRDGQLARVAVHLLACGSTGDRWVAERLRDAGREAMDRGAPDVAATYLRRALSEPPDPGERGTVLLMLGTAELRAGEPEAISRLEQALSLADDRGTRLAVTGVLAYAYHLSDRSEEAIAVLERALEGLDAPGGRPALELEGALVALGRMNARTAKAANRRAAALFAQLEGLVDPPVSLLAALALYAAQSRCPAGEAESLAERALACEPYPPPLDIPTVILPALVIVERYDLVERVSEDFLAAARGRSAIQELTSITAHRAWALHDSDALADAEAHARWVLERTSSVARWHALAITISVLIERDAVQEAQAELARVPPPRELTTVTLVPYLAARGRLRLAEGRVEEALEDFLACGSHCARLGITIGASRGWRGEAALVHHLLGDHEQARRFADEELALARAFERPRALGVALRVHGLVSEGEQRLSQLREAVQVLERSQARIELARALSDYGAALRRAGHRALARSQLEQGLDLAHHCGARRIAHRAREELVALGAKPRRDAITGRDALTASELRVARLAAQGMTNREIAQALFITAKTAKAHLSHTYRKLEITRRGQLADALTDRLPEGRDDPSATATIS